MGTSLVPMQNGFKNSDFVGRGSNTVFSRALSFLLQPLSTLGLFPYSCASILKNVCDQATVISAVGSISRTFSAPSSTGLFHQSVAKQTGIQQLTEPARRSLISALQRNVISVCRAGSVSPNIIHEERTNGLLLAMIRTAVAGVCNSPKSFDYFRIFSGGLHNQMRSDKTLNHCHASGFLSKFISYFQLWIKDNQLIFVAPYSIGASRITPLDGMLHEEQLESCVTDHNRRSLNDASLKLLSGSCYLPHPDKEKTGGEDAHFLCDDEQAIGVADGVGGWANFGIDAGLYAKELMSNSVSAIQEEPKGLINPMRVLEKAYSCTEAMGSSTACIIALNDEDIHAVNIGDSGFIVVRDDCIIFRSPIQQHGFNVTYQLQSKDGSDLPSSAKEIVLGAEPGDVIVAGTDGLFDNLYNNEINAIVVRAARARACPQATARRIAALASIRAQDKCRQTPFSAAAQDAGYRYYGGKLDDITVVVSFVTSNTNS